MSKKLFIYGIGIIFSKILVFLMVPIYTRVFAVSDYGYYDVIISDMQMIVSIAFVEIWSGIMRYMFADDDKYKPIKAMIKMLPFMIIVYAVIIFVISHIIELRYPFIICLYGIMYLLYNIATTICRGFNKNIDYVITGLIYTIISCGLSIIISFNYSKDIKYLFISQIIGYLMACIYVEIRTCSYKNSLKSFVDYKYILKMLKYSLPLMMNSFSFLFLGTYNKNVVLKVMGESASGQYAYVSKFSAIVSIIISIYSLAWQEQAFLYADREDRGDIYAYYINNFIKCIGLAIPSYILLSCFASPYIGGNGYLQATILIPMIVLSAFLADLSGIFSVVIAVNERTDQTFISTVMGAIVNVILVNFLVKKYGANGASLSLCIGFLVAAFARYIFVKKTINYKKIQGYLLAIILVEVMFIIKANNNIFLIVGFILFTMIWGLLNRNNIILGMNKIKLFIRNKQ